MVFDAEIVGAAPGGGATGASPGPGARLVQPRFGPGGEPENAAEVLASLRALPEALAGLRRQSPGLAAAADAGDLEAFSRALGQIGKGQVEEQRRRREELELLQADPLDPTAQARIAQNIAQHN